MFAFVNCYFAGLPVPASVLQPWITAALPLCFRYYHILSAIKLPQRHLTSLPVNSWAHSFTTFSSRIAQALTRYTFRLAAIFHLKCKLCSQAKTFADVHVPQHGIKSGMQQKRRFYCQINTLTGISLNSVAKCRNVRFTYIRSIR